MTGSEGPISTGGGWRVNAPRARTVLPLADLWRARDLLFFLAWRDVKVRYAQTFLGAAWAFLQPALMMLVFTLVFGRLIGTPTGGVPYPLFVIAGLLPWQLFSVALADVSNSVIANDRLLTKAAFPRIVLPVAATAPGIVDAGVAGVLLGILLAYYGVLPGATVVFAPLFLLLGLAASIGIGLWLAALNLRYRDVRYAIPFMLQLGLFLTPVAYPASAVPQWARTLYALNPMSSVVEGLRWSVLGTEPPSLSMLLASASVLFLSIVGGAVFFSRAERTFADVA